MYLAVPLLDVFVVLGTGGMGITSTGSPAANGGAQHRAGCTGCQSVAVAVVPQSDVQVRPS
jgi:hypothetical protein